MNYGKGKSQDRLPPRDRLPVLIRDENQAVIYGYKTAKWLQEQAKHLSEEELKGPAPVLDLYPVAKEVYLAFIYLKYKDREVVKRLYPPDPRHLRPDNALLEALSEEITLTERDAYELLQMQARFVAGK